jgi:hypothetical protein
MGFLGIVLSLTVLGCFAGGLLGKDHDEEIKQGIARVKMRGEERVRQLKAMGLTDYDIYGWAKMNNMYVEGINDQITGVFTGEETNQLAILRGAWKGMGPIGWTYNPNTKQWMNDTPDLSSQWDQGSWGGARLWDTGGPQGQYEAPDNIGGSPSQLLGSPTRQVRPFRPHQLFPILTD